LVARAKKENEKPQEGAYSVVLDSSSLRMYSQSEILVSRTKEENKKPQGSLFGWFLVVWAPKFDHREKFCSSEPESGKNLHGGISKELNYQVAGALRSTSSPKVLLASLIAFSLRTIVGVPVVQNSCQLRHSSLDEFLAETVARRRSLRARRIVLKHQILNRD
jgi:hypothetical protein